MDAGTLQFWTALMLYFFAHGVSSRTALSVQPVTLVIASFPHRMRQ
jgi:hypothetical protein